MEVVFRAAQEQDLKSVMSVLRTLPGSETSEIPTEQEENSWNEINSSDRIKVYVADIDRTIVGTASILLVASFCENPFAVLHNVAILPDYRGQNIGKNFLEFLYQEVAALGIQKITLQTQQPRAINFYTANFFEQTPNQSVVMKITPADTSP